LQVLVICVFLDNFNSRVVLFILKKIYIGEVYIRLFV
jgi:hypothetical protein